MSLCICNGWPTRKRVLPKKLPTIKGKTAKFGWLSVGERFSFSGHIYRKTRFEVVSDLNGCQGSTREVGGYNCVRLSNGRKGSFQKTTWVKVVF